MPWLTFKNKNIYYRLEGSGNPVMFLHGFGEDGSVWNEQINRFKDQFLVIVPDLPGSGRSELLDGPCTLDDYAEVVHGIANKEVRERAGQRQFCLVGHSMGGYIALAFARTYGTFLNSLGLFHSSAFADDADKIKTREKSIEFIEKNGAATFLQNSVPNLFAEETRRKHPDLVEKMIKLASQVSAQALVQYTKAMINRTDTTAVLKSIDKPVLFIIGVHDTSVPLYISLKQCFLPAKNAVHFLQHSGHLGMWEETSLSNLYLAAFLNGLVYPSLNN